MTVGGFCYPLTENLRTDFTEVILCVYESLTWKHWWKCSHFSLQTDSNLIKPKAKSKGFHQSCEPTHAAAKAMHVSWNVTTLWGYKKFLMQVETVDSEDNLNEVTHDKKKTKQQYSVMKQGEIEVTLDGNLAVWVNA